MDYHIILTALAITILVNIIILAGLKSSGDRSESTRFYALALVHNLAGSACAFAAYALFDAFGYPDVATFLSKLQVLEISLLYLMDIAWVSCCHFMVDYVDAISDKSRKTDKAARILSNVIYALVGQVVLSSLVSVIVLCTAGYAPTLLLVLNIAEMLPTLIVPLILFVVATINRKQLTRPKYIIIVVAVWITLAATVMYYFSQAFPNFAYPISTLSMLLFFVMIQMESINMSNVDSVRQALVAAEDMNTVLEEQHYMLQQAYEQMEENLLLLEHETYRLNQIADIFIVFYDISLKDKTFKPCGDIPEWVENAVNEVHAATSDIQELMWAGMASDVAEEFIEAGKAFTDFETLDFRMKGKKSLSMDAINHEKKWNRYFFIRPEDDLEAELESVFFITLDIDSDIRKIEYLHKVSFTDELTGVNNRNAFEAYGRETEENGIPADLWYLSVDLNGLKQANDTHGHKAGDELIIGMAHTLAAAVAKAGQVYRVGGDEFVAIINGTDGEVDAITQKLAGLAAEFDSEFGSTLSYSLGTVAAKEMPVASLADIERVADQRMYDQKVQYYKAKGINREGMRI